MKKDNKYLREIEEMIEERKRVEEIKAQDKERKRDEIIAKLNQKNESRTTDP